MNFATTVRSMIDRRGRGDLRDLRADLLTPIFVGTFAFAIIVTLLPDPLLRGGTEWTDPIAFSILSGLMIAFTIRQMSFELSAMFLLAGLLAAAFVGLGQFPLAMMTPWFALIVVLAGTLLGKRGSLLISVAASAGYWLAPSALVVLDEPMRLGLCILTWGAFGLTWLITQPLRTSLEWSWASYEHALSKTKEAEEHRGELAQALKELGATNYRLEVANAELERARAAAATARDLKARFAAFVSHELRLPLNIILGFSEMIVMSERSYHGEKLPPAYRTDVEAIYRAAFHLSSLVDDVLDLSELDAHQMGLEKEWTSISDVVNDAIGTTSGFFVGKDLTVSADVAPDLPEVFADATRIRQIVVNLLKNAARFTDRGGVRVIARRDASDLLVGIADTGIGIPAAAIPHVFDEFRQLESAGARRWGGSGLGLTISKRFAEMHGGSLWVESEIGTGSTFWLSIPLTTNVAALTSRENWETWVRHSPLNGADAPRIALAGLDRRLAQLIRRHLTDVIVVDAPRVDDTRQLLAESSLGGLLVVGDVDEAYRADLDQLSIDYPELPIVVCQKPPETDVMAGAADFLVKPIDRARLAAAIAPLGQPTRVLVVDDDAEMTRLLAAMVRSLLPDCLVWEASDGRAALDAIERERPQLVLLDLVMPEMTGQDVLQRLQRRGGEVPAVIVVSAGTSEGPRTHAKITRISRGTGLSAGDLIACLNATFAVLAPVSDSASQLQSAMPVG